MKKILTVLMVLVLVMTAFSTNVSADSVHLTDEERELFQDERKQFKNAEILFKIYPNACFIGNFPYGLSVQEIASLAPFEYYIIPAGHIFTTNLYGKNQIIACPPENTYKRGRIDFFMDLYQNGEKYLKQYMKKNLSIIVPI